MAQYTEYTTTTQLQPPVISQAPTIATQRVTPIIQNQNKTKIPLQSQIVYTSVQPEIVNQQQQQVAYMPVQQQPQVQNSNDFTRTIAQKYVTHLENQTQQQASTQGNLLDGGTIGQLKNEINANSERQLLDIYQGRQNTEAEKQKELEELRKFKERVDNEKKEAIINKQVEEKTEKKMSDLEDQQNQINDTVEAFESFDRSVFMDPDALRNYIDEVDKVSNIEDFRKLVDEEYARSQKENELNKQQNSDYLQHLEKQFSKDQQELTSKQSELNMHESSKSVFKKFIEWITGSKDEKAKELKARLAKLREEIKSDMVKIDDQKDALKKIIEKGVQIMRERTDEMERINKESKNENRRKRDEVNEIVNGKDYIQRQHEALKGHFNNKIQYIQGQIDNKNNYQTYINNVLEQRYPKKDVNNNNPKIMNLNSINEQKKKKGDGRGW